MKRAVLLTFLFAALTTMVWARDFRMAADPSVPAAQGRVSTDTDRNGNTKLHVDVDHLAQPSALTPASNTYVVWIQARGQAPQNVGELRVNPDLHGSFRTSVPYKSFDVYVTAERDPRASAPSGPELLKTTVD
jgi:hypothetical protein